MFDYLIRRFLSLILTLFISTIIIFIALEIIPGDPAEYMLGINAEEDTINALREELGLNKSKIERYFSWLIGMIQGDFGVSYTYGSPVNEMVLDRLKVSLPLALMALFISTIICGQHKITKITDIKKTVGMCKINLLAKYK